MKDQCPKCGAPCVTTVTAAASAQDYPPLPDKDFIGDDVCWGYDEQSMRDYVDADRAARSPATVAQPVEWLPTPTNVNALPGPVRGYIHDLVANCDPSNMVRENAMLRDTNAGLQKMYRAAADALAEVRGCFEMAESEGLSIALAETVDERLKDLVERRLMHASYVAQPCPSQGCGGAVSKEQINRAIDAWFGFEDEDTNNFDKRMRAALAALSAAKSVEHGATDGGTGE